ncbi:MAG: ATP-binding protein [Chloroflexota bacterium]
MAYGVGLVTSALALVIWQIGLQKIEPDPFPLFLLAVVLSSWWAGFGPGLFATAIGFVASLYYIPPANSLAVGSSKEAFELAIFAIAALAIAWLNGERRQLVASERSRRLTAEQQAGTLETDLSKERSLQGEIEVERARAAFLAEASKTLAGSLDYEATLRTVARLAVPNIADWCTVDIVGEDGQVSQLAVEHIDPNKVQLAVDLQKRYPYDPESPSGTANVLRTGQPEMVSEITDELLVEASPDEYILGILRELGLRSTMTVPLIARDRTLGAITLIRAETGRPYGDADLSLATDLAARAALAVDNAHLYTEAQRVAAERSSILTQMADGVAIADATGRVTFVNESAARLVGESVAGRTIEEYAEPYQILTADGEPYPPDELPLVRALRDRTVVTDTEWSMRRQDGVELIMHGTAAPIESEDGVLLGAVSTFHDVTGQRALERAREDFFSAAAHDLKTPLATIKGLAQMLQRRLQRANAAGLESVTEGLKDIDSSVTRMTRLINEMLDATRAQLDRPLELNRQRTDLVEVVERAVAECRRAADRHEVCVEALVPEIIGEWDSERLERVLANLLSNAVKYSPKGGEIVVSVAGGRETGEAVVTVVDHGMGIPAANVPHIFERFYRGSNTGPQIPGTGIGLAGARQIVEQHGGSIEVESEECQGSTFAVRLPIIATAPVSGEENVTHG